LAVARAPVQVKVIINIMGPFTDALLVLDNPRTTYRPPIVGVHVTFHNYYSPRNMGLLDPTRRMGTCPGKEPHLWLPQNSPQ